MYVCDCHMHIHVYTLKTFHLRHRVDNSRESIQEDNESKNWGREEPRRVEANPREVDTNLLTKVAPNRWSVVRTGQVCSYRVHKLHPYNRSLLFSLSLFSPLSLPFTPRSLFPPSLSISLSPSPSLLSPFFPPLSLPSNYQFPLTTSPVAIRKSAVLMIKFAIERKSSLGRSGVQTWQNNRNPCT